MVADIAQARDRPTITRFYASDGRAYRPADGY